MPSLLDGTSCMAKVLPMSSSEFLMVFHRPVKVCW